MTVKFATLTAASGTNNDMAAFVNQIMEAAGGSADVTPDPDKVSYYMIVRGSIVFNGVMYALPDGATQLGWNATASVAYDTEAGVCVIFSGTTPANTTATDNAHYVASYVHMVIAGGHLWWKADTELSSIAETFNVGSGVVKQAADTTRAMLTPLIADGIDMTPVFISQNFVVDTAGTTVTDTAGTRFVSLGNLLYIREATASEPAGTAVTCRVGSVSTLPAGSQATVSNVGTLNDVILDFGIPEGVAGPKGDKGDTGTGGQVDDYLSTENATIIGRNASATNDNTNVTLIGHDATAPRKNATAVGATTVATEDSIAIGSGATAPNAQSTVIGRSATGGGQQGTVLGWQAASAGWATAVGARSKASGNASTAIGTNAQADGDHATAVGSSTTASGAYSIAIGSQSQALDNNTVSVGNDTLKRRIVYVADPTAATDAATKAYVDAIIAKLKSDNGLK